MEVEDDLRPDLEPAAVTPRKDHEETEADNAKLEPPGARGSKGATPEEMGEDLSTESEDEGVL